MASKRNETKPSKFERVASIRQYLQEAQQARAEFAGKPAEINTACYEAWKRHTARMAGERS